MGLFSEGTTPRRSDTRWVVLEKILQATIDGGGGGGGGSQLLEGDGPPQGGAYDPPSDPTTRWDYWDRISGSDWVWNTSTLAWE